jgi:hypothetical protein
MTSSSVCCGTPGTAIRRPTGSRPAAITASSRPLGRRVAISRRRMPMRRAAYRCVFRLRVQRQGSLPMCRRKPPTDGSRLHIFDRDYVLTDAADLAKLERWLKNAAPLPAGAGCPFGSVLTLTCGDGVRSPAVPRRTAARVFANGVYYRYASDNEGSGRCSAFSCDDGAGGRSPPRHRATKTTRAGAKRSRAGPYYDDSRPYASKSSVSMTHSFLIVPTSVCSASMTCGRVSPRPART